MNELGAEAIQLSIEQICLKRRKNESDDAFRNRKRERAEAVLSKKCNNQQYTMLRKHFKGYAVIPAENLVWLVKNRGFHSYEIVHFISYQFRSYLSSFITSILQLRHDLTLTGQKHTLKSTLYKQGRKSIQRFVIGRGRWLSAFGRANYITAEWILCSFLTEPTGYVRVCVSVCLFVICTFP